MEIVKADPDNDIITVGDLELSEKNLPVKQYDAFVIYNDKDVEFASELIKQCEDKGYSLCVRDRDLLGGISMEDDAVLNLVSKRCQRLIVIVSKAFLRSPMQLFITNFAQAVGIQEGKRKIIPCLLEPCELPQMLRFCFRLDYFKSNKLYNFWEKLDQSLRQPATVRDAHATRSVTEFDAFHDENVPATPESLYDQEQVYKFTETPIPAEKMLKSFFPDSPTPEKKKIFPTPKLRSSSSMVGLNQINSDALKPPKNKFSQSTFHLNQDVTDEAGLETIKRKRKKWYKMFMPPSSKNDAKVSKVIHEEPEKKLPKKTDDKHKWYKISKKKKDKQKVAIAVQA